MEHPPILLDEPLPANEIRSVRTLMWDVIAARLHPAERDEVKR